MTAIGNESDDHHRRLALLMKRVPFIPNTLKLLLAALSAVAAYGFHQGYIQSRYSPLFELNLEDADTWFLDWRISQLKNDPIACKKVLRGSLIKATPVRARVQKNGCGWSNAFAVSSLGGARIAPVTVSCELAAALSMWIAHSVQIEAQRLFGSRVASISHVGGYSCRSIRGGIGQYIDVKSEHSFANALDIIAFRLANGKRISVYSGWKRNGAQSEFLRTIHDTACDYFRVVLGPDANDEHADHFHLDRGWLISCR